MKKYAGMLEPYYDAIVKSYLAGATPISIARCLIEGNWSSKTGHWRDDVYAIATNVRHLLKTAGVYNRHRFIPCRRVTRSITQTWTPEKQYNEFKTELLR
jgi:hypothetical protein